MTKKHYIAIAKIIQHAHNCCYLRDDLNPVVEMIEKDLTDYFAGTNPLFDKERFVKACTGGE